MLIDVFKGDSVICLQHHAEAAKHLAHFSSASVQFYLCILGVWVVSHLILKKEKKSLGQVHIIAILLGHHFDRNVHVSTVLHVYFKTYSDASVIVIIISAKLLLTHGAN